MKHVCTVQCIHIYIYDNVFVCVSIMNNLNYIYSFSIFSLSIYVYYIHIY